VIIIERILSDQIVQHVRMPYGARIISAALHDGELRLYAEVDERQPRDRTHEIMICHAGNKVPPAPARHIATIGIPAPIRRGVEALHIYEVNTSPFEWSIPNEEQHY
jgi:hypothetical protein